MAAHAIISVTTQFQSNDLMKKEYESAMLFGMALPLGAVYWFGLTFMQILGTMAFENVVLVPINYMGYFCIAIPVLALFFLIIRQKRIENKFILLNGFAIAAFAQPFLFAIYHILVVCT